jgi:hypothetical protein
MVQEGDSQGMSGIRSRFVISRSSARDPDVPTDGLCAAMMAQPGQHGFRVDLPGCTTVRLTRPGKSRSAEITSWAP